MYLSASETSPPSFFSTRSSELAKLVSFLKSSVDNKGLDSSSICVRWRSVINSAIDCLDSTIEESATALKDSMIYALSIFLLPPWNLKEFTSFVVSFKFSSATLGASDSALPCTLDTASAISSTSFGTAGSGPREATTSLRASDNKESAPSAAA